MSGRAKLASYRKTDLLRLAAKPSIAPALWRSTRFAPVSSLPPALDETGHFYFAQTGHSHFAATFAAFPCR